ncbi:hypothetical protein DEU56DRAFT_908894 [Suillus clintonianus]|uniref:uncharacterized protein n=1 Tax=Suillus clintonianus TaxID=1904413 RepID=UPI001B886712|nr:uncharacterized protein DEU56DRAFT_908894 [Suillus clintonianus]KAG2149188.1 hypothetical protein DEU56DRAFT_908894 [Suillus clintonianus]
MSTSFSLSTIIMIIFVFVVMITVLGILLLVIVRVHRSNDRDARHSWFSGFPRSKESSGEYLTDSLSCPTVVGLASTKVFPVMHVTVTPPTPARVPTLPHKSDPYEKVEVYKLSRNSRSEGMVYGYAI